VQAGPDLLVPRHEPASETLVVEHARALAQAIQNGIGILQEGWIGRIERQLILYKHGLTIRLNPPS
jgi:hypothetical protein